MKGYAELEIVFQRNSLDEFQASFRQRFDESENITPFHPAGIKHPRSDILFRQPAKNGPVIIGITVYAACAA